MLQKRPGASFKVMRTLLALGLAMGSSACAGLGASVSPLGAPYGCQPPGQSAAAYLLTSAQTDSAHTLSLTSGSDAKTDPVDHNAFWVLRVDMGEKPTGGYRLELLSDTLAVQGEHARLKLDYKQPAPDSMVTQAFAYPCLILQLPKGDYSVIEVVDIAGDVRHQVTLPGQ